MAQAQTNLVESGTAGDKTPVTDSIVDMARRYVIVTCRSMLTLALARALFLDFGIRAWAPRRAHKVLIKGKKRVQAVMPGFVFILASDYDKAFWAQKRLLVPAFRPLVMGSEVCTCSEKELQELQSTINGENVLSLEGRVNLRVGDSVKIVKGVFEGFNGVVEEIYIDHCLMVKLKSDFCPAIKVPAAFIG